MGYSSPRLSRGSHYAILVSLLKVSQVFKLQDKHNASFKSFVLTRALSYPMQKYKKIVITNTFIVNYCIFERNNKTHDRHVPHTKRRIFFLLRFYFDETTFNGALSSRKILRGGQCLRTHRYRSRWSLRCLAFRRRASAYRGGATPS